MPRRKKLLTTDNPATIIANLQRRKDALEGAVNALNAAKDYLPQDVANLAVAVNTEAKLAARDYRYAVDELAARRESLQTEWTELHQQLKADDNQPDVAARFAEVSIQLAALAAQ